MFFQYIKDTFGDVALNLVKMYVQTHDDLVIAIDQKEFLKSLKHNRLYNKKVIDSTKNIDNMHFKSNTIKQRSSRLCDELQTSLLNLEIKDIHFHINFLNKKITNTYNRLQSIIPEDFLNNIVQHQNNKTNSIINNNQIKTKKKIDNIKNKYYKNKNIFLNQHKILNPNFSYNEDPWFCNFSNCDIDPNIQDFLRLGSNFYNPNFISKKKQALEAIKDVESNIYKIPEDYREEFRHIFIQNTQNFLSHKNRLTDFDIFISDKYKLTKEFLDSNPDIIVTHADKTKTTVVLKKQEYTNKMKQNLDDLSNYKEVPDPTRMVKNRIKNLFAKWREAKYFMSTCSIKNTNLPRAYGLIKLHKENQPARIIVPCIDSPVEELANFYKDILTAASPRPKHVIKNILDFKEQIQNIRIPSNHTMASLDVESMFPSIPIELVKKSIQKRWNKIKTHTSMPQSEFIRGLEILMDSLYFKFNSTFYKQINGLPMGLSISPIIADLVLQDIEEDFLSKYKKSITCYFRYVDDSFIIIIKNKLPLLVKYLNSVHSRLKFTVEKEGEKQEKNKISFLDLLVERKQDGSIILDLYKKKTFSGRYINFLSSHSIAIKIGIIKSYMDKIFKLSDPIYHQKNIKILKNDLILNNYPVSFIDKHIKNAIFRKNSHLSNLDLNNNNSTGNKFDFKKIFVLSNLGKYTEKLKYTLKKKF